MASRMDKTSETGLKTRLLSPLAKEPVGQAEISVSLTGSCIQTSMMLQAGAENSEPETSTETSSSSASPKYESFDR